MTSRRRPLLALLFHVLLLHVSVLGGGMACAPAWAALARAAAPTAAHGAHHAADEPPQAPVPHHDGAPAHCVTAAGCAAVAVAAPEVTPAALAPGGVSVTRAPVRVSGATRAAPEPPPPRG